jgi:hypothetical protein
MKKKRWRHYFRTAPSILALLISDISGCVSTREECPENKIIYFLIRVSDFAPLSVFPV